MRKTSVLLISLTLSIIALASSTVTPMNKAFSSLGELLPYLTDENKFKDKKNEEAILQHIKEIDQAFKVAKHGDLLKKDIFAPSLALIRENISNSREAFLKGKKDYAHWRMKEITTQCLDCHARLPSTHPSSFQEGFQFIDSKKIPEAYNLGITYLIVRQYPEAKTAFTRKIDESFLKSEFKEIMPSLKQLLMIHTKIMKEPEQMLTLVKHYETKKGFSQDDLEQMKSWKERLAVWKDNPATKNHLDTESETSEFISKSVKPLFSKDDLYLGKFDVDLLMVSGLLSNYLFENPESKIAPEVLYWIALSEKYLKREEFFGTGDLLLKECVRRYSTSPVAKKCFQEYQDSMEFEFTGSGGTQIPLEVKKELEELQKLLNKRK